MRDVPRWFHRSIGAALAALVLVAPLSAGAQLTLVVRDEPSADETIAAAVDDALRDATGSSARRVEPTLDDLALAAGCEGEPTDPDCVAAIAAAGSAHLVAIEHVERLPTGARVRIDLRRGADGMRLRTVVAECSPETCAEAMRAAMERPAGAAIASLPPPDAAAGVREARARRSRAREPVVVVPAPIPEPGRGEAPGHARDDEEPPRPPRPGPPLERTLFFGGAVLSSVAATIAGAVAIDSASAAADLSGPDGDDASEQRAGLESRRDVSLGLASGFALAGAGLALAGLLVPADGHELRIVPVPVAGLGAAAAIDVRF